MNDNVQNGEVIIDINDLSKAFGDLKVLTNISTQIRKGDVDVVSSSGAPRRMEYCLENGALRHGFRTVPNS